MLQSLRIRNLAIAEDVRLELRRGLNVITGETGAGKSLLADALGLALGERADRTLLRQGADHCSVEAVFQLRDAEAVDEVLEDSGLPPCDEGVLVIRRSVQTNGSGKVFVNDSPVTLALVKRLGDLLVDMHGPHEHQSLLHPAFQLDTLDSFAHAWDAREKVEELDRTANGLRAEIRELDGDDTELALQVEALQQEIREVEAAELAAGEEEALRKEHTILANANRIVELGGAACEGLTGDEGSAFERLTAVERALVEMARYADWSAEMAGEAESLVRQAQDLSKRLAARVQSIEGDPARLQWVEERMALLLRLKRRYGTDIPAILAWLADAKDKLQGLLTRNERRAELQARLEACLADYRAAAARLTRQRANAGTRLAAAILNELRPLGFQHGQFAVRLAPCEPGPAGVEQVEFMFAPNQGEPERPLRAIASSGEISRVMLAVKTVLAAHDRIPVLFFDEIDSNVGGEMGNAIGAKLETIAAGHQVICITHLPQVAAFGGAHYQVSKSVHDGRTRTEIRILDDKERAEELARMLGGKDLTSVTLKHAREMLSRRAKA